METAGAKVREEAKKEKRIKKKTGGRRNLFARFWPLYLMLLPLIVYLFIFNYYPMFGLQIAFKDWYVRKGITKKAFTFICSFVCVPLFSCAARKNFSLLYYIIFVISRG